MQSMTPSNELILQPIPVASAERSVHNNRYVPASIEVIFSIDMELRVANISTVNFSSVLRLFTAF